MRSRRRNENAPALKTAEISIFPEFPLNKSWMHCAASFVAAEIIILEIINGLFRGSGLAHLGRDEMKSGTKL